MINSLKYMNSCLIDVKRRIELINNKDALAIDFFDLKCFYKLSKIDSISFEKNLREIILSTNNYVLSFIESDIDFYITFYNKYQSKLELVNKSSIVNNKLSYEKRKMDEVFEELKMVSFKRDEINGKIESNVFSLSENSADMILLRKQEKHAKKEREKINQIYLKKFDYYTNKHNKYSTYTLFKFIDIFNELNKIIELVNSYKTKNNRLFDNSKGIMDYERVGIIYRLSKPYFNFEITEEELINRLNLNNVTPIKLIKNGSIEKFSYIIEEVLKTFSITIDKKKQWEKEFTSASSINLQTFKKGNKAENAEDFKKEVNKSLLHFKKS